MPEPESEALLVGCEELSRMRLLPSPFLPPEPWNSYFTPSTCLKRSMPDVIHGRGKKEEGGEIFQLFAVEIPLSSAEGALAPPGRKKRSEVFMQCWGKGDFKVSLAENLNFQQVPACLGLQGSPG